MKTEQLEEIIDDLANWRKQRHLTLDMQLQGLLPNLLEEALELTRATNSYDRIDALCDLAVFSLNTLGHEANPKDIVKHFNIMSDRYEYVLCDYPSILLDITETFLYADENDEEHTINLASLRSLVAQCFAYIYRHKFDPFKCMKETIKEISSRTGKFDESIGKWIKDTSNEAKSKWYKADYAKCSR